MRNRYQKALAVVAGGVIASGCSTLAADNTSRVAGSDSSTAVELESAQRRVSQLESELATRDSEIANMEARLSGNGNRAASMSGDASLFPPNPKAGECYARVLIPATYKSESERVLTRDAGERIEVIPASYETIEERVVIKEASTRLEVVPAVYGEVQERVMVRPATKKIVEFPAEYRTVAEQVVDQPAHTAWKKGPAATQTSTVLSEAMTDTGEIMCLVEVPATYKTVEKRVLVSPARTDEVELPAEYRTVTRTVVKEPATTREVTIPAEYSVVPVAKLVTPAKVNRIEIPAAYESVTRTSKVTDEQMEWRQVMCEVNMTRDSVLSLQRALADAGYYRDGIDGVIGPQTLAAARAYALANNLPAGTNYVPMEVVEGLELSL